MPPSYAPARNTDTKGFYSSFLSNILVKGADAIDKERLFSCQFLAVIMNSPLLLTDLQMLHSFLNSSFACNVFLKWHNY